MLGIIRFIFALLVVLAHLSGLKELSHTGIFAVFGFYLVSGYLITLILNDRYLFDFKTFALNRFLRLFPIYYLVCLIAIPLIFLFEGADKFHWIWKIDLGWKNLPGILFIFPLEFYENTFRFVPSTWSVAVELVNYFLLWLVIARSKKITILVVFISIIYHVFSIYLGQSWAVRYYPFYAALLPFSLGALIYFINKSYALSDNKNIPNILLIVCLTFCINLITTGYMGGIESKFFVLNFYINIVALFLLFIAATNFKFESKHEIFGKKLGDLAYPIFLIHWIIGFAVSLILDNGKTRGLELLLYSIPPIIAISYVLSKLSDKLIEPMRNKIRPNLTATISTQKIHNAQIT